MDFGSWRAGAGLSGSLEHYPVSWDQFDGCKSVHPGRRVAKRDAVPYAKRRNAPGGPICPTGGRVLIQAKDVVARPL